MRRRQILASRAAKAEEPKVAPTPEDVRARYVAMFGKSPHWKMKPETILERVNGSV